jgi:predicted nucleic acid-binding protein
LQEEFFPSHQAIRYGAEEAVISAGIYRQLPRARSREFDLAIAACAITQGARLWTLNLADFADIPGLQLFRPDVA